MEDTIIIKVDNIQLKGGNTAIIREDSQFKEGTSFKDILQFNLISQLRG
jgi:hypothetical protein